MDLSSVVFSTEPTPGEYFPPASLKMEFRPFEQNEPDTLTLVMKGMPSAIKKKVTGYYHHDRYPRFYIHLSGFLELYDRLKKTGRYRLYINISGHRDLEELIKTKSPLIFYRKPATPLFEDIVKLREEVRHNTRVVVPESLEGVGIRGINSLFSSYDTIFFGGGLTEQMKKLGAQLDFNLISGGRLETQKYQFMLSYKSKIDITIDLDAFRGDKNKLMAVMECSIMELIMKLYGFVGAIEEFNSDYGLEGGLIGCMSKELFGRTFEQEYFLIRAAEKRRSDIAIDIALRSLPPPPSKSQRPTVSQPSKPDEPKMTFQLERPKFSMRPKR